MVCPGQPELQELEILSRLNIALCDINLKFYERSLQQCAFVIDRDPKRVKAYIRMAQSIFLFMKDKFKLVNAANTDALKHTSYRMVQYWIIESKNII
tara:strand:- start:708 stop:998 length:291 start_codon:yes stop_codon:yes gene_type:complete